MKITDASFSPDGKLVAFLAYERSKSHCLRVARCNHPGKAITVASAYTLSKSNESLSLQEKLLRERYRKRTEGITEYFWVPNPPAGCLGCVILPFRGNLFCASVVEAADKLEVGTIVLVYDKSWLASALCVPTSATVAQQPQAGPDGTRLAFHAAGEVWITLLPHADGFRSSDRYIWYITYDDTRLELDTGDHPAQAVGRTGAAPGTRLKQATPSPIPGITRGLANYLEAEELDRYEGFWWSPNSRFICFQETDQTPVPEFSISHPAADDPNGKSAVEVHRYPFSGCRNPRGRLGIARVEAAPMLRGLRQMDPKAAGGCTPPSREGSEQSARAAAGVSTRASTAGTNPPNPAAAFAGMQYGSAAGDDPFASSTILSHHTKDGIHVHVYPPMNGLQWLYLASKRGEAGATASDVALESVRVRLPRASDSDKASSKYGSGDVESKKTEAGLSLPSHAEAVAAALDGTVLDGGFLARVTWSPDATLFVQVLNREQTIMDLVRFRVFDGACDLIVREVASPPVPGLLGPPGEKAYLTRSSGESKTEPPDASKSKQSRETGPGRDLSTRASLAEAAETYSGSPQPEVFRPWINITGCLGFIPYEAHGTKGADVVVDQEDAELDGLAAGDADARGVAGAAARPETFLLWGSERSGFNHLYLYRVTSTFSADDPASVSHVPLAEDDPALPGEAVAERGQLIRRVTHGQWNVLEVLKIDSAGGDGSLPCRVYFMANARSPLERHVYRAPVFATAAAGPVVSPRSRPLGRAGAAANSHSPHRSPPMRSYLQSAIAADPGTDSGETSRSASTNSIGSSKVAVSVGSGGPSLLPASDASLMEPAADLRGWGHGCSLGAIEAVTGCGFGRWHSCCLQPTAGHRSHDALMVLTSSSSDAMHEHRVVAASTIGQVRSAKEWAVRVHIDCVEAGDGLDDGAGAAASKAAGAAGGKAHGDGDGVQLVLDGDSTSASSHGSSASPHSPAALGAAVPFDVSESNLTLTEIVRLGAPTAEDDGKPPARHGRPGSRNSSDVEGSQTSESQYSGHTAAGSATETGNGIHSRRSSPTADKLGAGHGDDEGGEESGPYDDRGEEEGGPREGDDEDEGGDGLSRQAGAGQKTQRGKAYGAVGDVAARVRPAKLASYSTEASVSSTDSEGVAGSGSQAKGRHAGNTGAVGKVAAHRRGADSTDRKPSSGAGSGGASPDGPSPEVSEPNPISTGLKKEDSDVSVSRSSSGQLTTAAEMATGWQFFACPSADPSATLFGAVLVPDADKFGAGPYPTVVSVYGGPHVQLVCENANYMLRDRVSAALSRSGVAVVKVDNRGSANRGTAFEGAIHLRLGGVEVEDQLAALRFLAGKGIVDLKNKGRGVGVRGWSYGGYMTLMMMCKHPTVFRCGVAGAPVTSWNDYDSAYTERYHSTPEDNPRGYEESSVLHRVGQLRSKDGSRQSKLLLIHGLIDENVIFRHSAKLMQRLMAAKVRYDSILLPGERHTPRDPASLEYIHSRTTEHLVDCLTKGL